MLKLISLSLTACLLPACSLPLPFLGGRQAEVLVGFATHDPVRKLVRRVVPGIDFRLGS